MLFNKIIELLYLNQKNNLVFYDKLTELLNRNWLEYHRDYLDNAKLYITMIDLDNLKTVNDTKGHEEGDKLISGFSNSIYNYFSKDYVIRLGGDEFVIISKQEPVEKLFSIRKIIPYNFSFGICRKDKNMNLTEALTKADQHMYCMKSWQKEK